MNHLAVVLVWCVLQVTLLSLLAAAAYLLLRRFGPKAGILVLMTSLLLIIGLSLMMFSPWPRWMGTAEARPFSAKKAALAMASKRDAPGPVGAKHPVKGDGADHLASSEQSAHAAPVGQPALALWLQSMRDELTLRRPVTAAEEPITERRASWPIAIVAVLLLAAAFGLIRLIVGLIVVRQYRHQSTVIRDPRLSEMTDLLLAELGCRRRLELRELAALVSAATVGWRRPIILLPGRWTIWSDQQLRAILAHELAHVRSNDFLAGLLGQIGLALHFYHPLVHWLMGRLKLEQELAADSVAAQLSGGPGIYLTTIAEMALAQDDHNVGWPARAFLPARSTLLRRISMLRNSQSPIAPISRGVRVISICVMLLLGLAVAGLRPGVSPGVEAQAEEPAKEQAPETRSSDRQKALNLLNKTIAHSGDQLIRKGEFTYEVTSKGEVPTASEIAELNRRTREQLLAASEAATDPKQKAYLKSLAEEDNDYGPAMIANAHLKLQFYFACDGSSVGGDHYWERRTRDAASQELGGIHYFLVRGHGARASDCIQLDQNCSGKVGPVERVGFIQQAPHHFGRISGTIMSVGPEYMLSRLDEIELAEGLQFDGQPAVEIRCRVKNFHTPGIAEIKYLVVPTMGYIVPSVQEYDSAGNISFECRSEDYFEIADSSVMFPRKCVTTTVRQERRVETFTFEPENVKINANVSRSRLTVPVPVGADFLFVDSGLDLVAHSPVELGIDDIQGLPENPAFHVFGDGPPRRPPAPRPRD